MDEEIRLCEAYLQDPSNLKGLPNESLEEVPNDSLLETLRDVGNQTHDFDSQELVAQIQSLVPGQDIGEEELDRILSPAESAEEIGRIGRYRVIEFLAGGGMGYVFKAEDPELDRLVCIKVLDPLLARSEDAKTRFAREAKAASKLCNSRITTVLGFGTHKELPFLVMELLEGQSLRAKLNDEGNLDPQLAEKFTLQIAQGLRYAHQRGILHRDIKPENIWVTPEGDIKLLDFGLARSIEATADLTQSGTILGTPNYMSPEQVQGKELDQRSDLFSVGSVLFEMLTGESPFGKSNLFSTMMSVANDTLAYPEPKPGKAIPKPLTNVIDSLLQKDPQDRIASAEDLIALFEGDAAQPNARAKKSNSNRWIIGILGALAGAACLAMAFFIYQLNDKGKLIVEADPSVKVSIADERVAIEDPQTGKSFDVTIGEHPLPSGVYQLQMADESGNYTLSSNIITIRRGEDQIVRVELKPSEKMVAETSKVRTSEPKTTELKAKAANTTAKIAAPNRSLSALPTLDASELKRKLGFVANKPLFPAAVISNPSPKEGITSWSIEGIFDSNSAQLNADGSLIAFANKRGQKTVIRDSNGKLLHLIPAGDSIAEVSWAPDPNVIAVVENGDVHKRVVVWKLLGDHVKVIDVISCDCEKVGWSWDGLKLALQAKGSNEITFVNLARKGGVFAQPNLGIEGSISARPWSTNGRYFSANLEEEVGVWDLKDQRVVHVFKKKTEARFLAEENLLAVKSGKDWEVWDVGTFERKRLLKRKSGWRRTWSSPDFRKQLAMRGDGRFVLKDAVSGDIVESEFRIRNLSGDVHWAANGNGFVISSWFSGTFVSVGSGDGRLEELANIKPLGEFARRFVTLPNRGSRQLRIADYSGTGKVAWLNDLNFSPEKAGSISVFDLESSKSLPDTEFRMFETGARYRISPDGKHVAIVGSDSPSSSGILSKQWSKDVSKVRVCSVATGKVVRTFDTGNPQSLLWTPDSSSLVVSVVRYQTKEEAEKEVNDRIEKVFREMLERSDQNKDGKLDAKEMSGSNLMRLDRNKDGYLTAYELGGGGAYNRRTQSRSRRGELETKVISLSEDKETVLSLDPLCGSP